MINNYESVITKPEQLIIDNVYYKVTKVESYSFITEVIITSKPYKSRHTDSLFINCLVIKDNEISYNTEFSLVDYNVVPNEYNKHHIFSNYNEALKYSKE